MASNVDENGVSSQVDENDAELDRKRDLMTGKLQKREDERLEDVQRRKDESESSKAANESTDLFLKKFSQAKSQVEEMLEKSNGLSKTQLTPHFDEILVLITKMQKYMTDSMIFLTAFDGRKAQESVGKLQSSLQEKRDQLMPKKKFAFKGKKKTEEKGAVPAVDTQKKEIKVEISGCNFADKSNETLIKTSDELNNQDVALARLTDCTVKLYGSPGAVHINKLKNCKVFSGPVSGSVFMDECINCVFVMPCQQMRIHSTRDTDFYIHVTSKAIIEDCQEVRFAPYNWKYGQIEEHYKVSGLDKSRNTWDNVDDFNWLAMDTKSPNWSTLPVEKRMDTWDE